MPASYAAGIIQQRAFAIPDECLANEALAPYPHLNSLNKGFYRTARPAYTELVRDHYKNMMQESQVIV